jgi:SagB-type dehydrogenase family enzyme
MTPTAFPSPANGAPRAERPRSRATEPLLRLHPAVRIQPPSSLTGARWTVENYVGLTRFKLPMPGIMLLIAAAVPSSPRDLVRTVADRTGLAAERVTALLSRLHDAGLLVEAGNEGADVARFAATVDVWSRSGWEEAAQYHLSTFDYPFVDYDVGGREIDTGRMHDYVRREPDVSRYKRYPDAPRLALPEPGAELLPVELADALRSVDGTPLDRDRLERLLSMTFAEIGRISTARWPRAPMVRRTSPSGGARHPTEAYVLALNVAGLAPGWYHVGVSPPELEMLDDELPSESELAELFPLGYVRVPIAVDAIVILTSVFERNMFRYREPRTFRTVHMDAGHLAATLVLAAAGLDVRAHVAYPDNDELIERQLGLSGLREGFMLSVALGALPADRRRTAGA